MFNEPSGDSLQTSVDFFIRADLGNVAKSQGARRKYIIPPQCGRGTIPRQDINPCVGKVSWKCREMQGNACEFHAQLTRVPASWPSYTPPSPQPKGHPFLARPLKHTGVHSVVLGCVPPPIRCRNAFPEIPPGSVNRTLCGNRGFIRRNQGKVDYYGGPELSL